MNSENGNDIVSDSTLDNISLDTSIQDFGEEIQTIIGLQEQQLTIMAQNNTNQLFVIGTFSSVFVLALLYFAIKKFL